ncbi:MAG: hypothetical protein QOE65_2849 [Solirubrobacteraceae bacterium]|jgi:diguanylate cyclase (GGDEF)-like protein|nr:hypothetical protein [Solirubrobacteraceae bacterium]
MAKDDDVRLLWRLTVAMYLAGGVTLLAVLALPDPDTSDHAALAAIAGVNVLIGLALRVAGPRRGLVRLALALGVLTISAAVAAARPLGAVSFFYLWPLLGSAYFLSRRELALTLGLTWASFGAALAFFSPPGLRLAMFMGTSVATTVVTLTMRLLRERRDRLLAELHRTAATDSLTGLLNRRAFESAFARELERGRRSALPLTLALFDLDLFKQVNDRFGHAAGDRVLVEFADRLRREARQVDVVARVGGEEFAVVLPGTTPEGARRYAHRVAAELERAAPEPEAPVSVSAGLAAHGPALDTVDALLLAADGALYVAKAAGRDRVAVFGGEVWPAKGSGRAGDGGALEGPADLVDRHDPAQAAVAVHGEERPRTA